MRITADSDELDGVSARCGSTREAVALASFVNQCGHVGLLSR